MVNSPLWLVPALPLYTPTAATMVQVSSPNAEDGRRARKLTVQIRRHHRLSPINPSAQTPCSPDGRQVQTNHLLTSLSRGQIQTGPGYRTLQERAHLNGPLSDDLTQLGDVVVFLDGCSQVPVVGRLDCRGLTPKSSLGEREGGTGWSRGVDSLGSPARGSPSKGPSLAAGCYPGSHGCGWGCSTSLRSHSGSRGGRPRARPAQPAPGSGRRGPATQGWLCGWRVARLPSQPCLLRLPIPSASHRAFGRSAQELCCSTNGYFLLSQDPVRAGPALSGRPRPIPLFPCN